MKNMSKRKTWVVGLGIALVVVLGGGYMLFGAGARMPWASAKSSAPARPRVDRSVPELSGAINKPLPEALLVDLKGESLPAESLRKGKVVLVFVNPECSPCVKEAAFLRTVFDKRQDIRFYGVATLGNKESSLKESENLFAFKTYYDEEAMLAKGLGIVRMPIKIFLEDGVVKETWGGASKNQEIQADFVEWVENVK
jgi:thiol-disulfide isomerase/thioredoxin